MALSKGASIAIVTVICLVFGVLIGFLVGWFSRAPHDAVILRHVPSKLVEDADNEIRDKILSYVDTEKLREYSRFVTFIIIILCFHQYIRTSYVEIYYFDSFIENILLNRI